MSKEQLKGISYFFLMITLIFGVFYIYIGIEPYEMIFGMSSISLFFYVLSIYAKPEKKAWVCQNCQVTLIRKQIKFGLCPHCGVKVKGFRGLSHRTNIYDF